MRFLVTKRKVREETEELEEKSAEGLNTRCFSLTKWKRCSL